MALTDPFWGFRKNEFLGSGTSFVAITPHASTDIPTGLTRGVYVGVGGNIAVVGADNVEVVFKGAAAGALLPIRARRINAVNTTATDLVAIY